MLPLPNLEELQALLLHLPAIVQRYEEKDATFVELAKEWLRVAEELLVRNSLPVAGAVAGLRGAVISAERGFMPAGMSAPGTSAPRRLRDFAAAEALRRAEELVSGAMRQDVAQLQDAEGVMRQMVVVAHYKGYLDVGATDVHRTDALQLLWSRFLADADLIQGAVRVSGLVGLPTAFALLDREMLRAGVGA